MLSKLGFHVQGATPKAIEAVTSQRGATGIKIMDLQSWAVDALQIWKRNNPGGLVTYRMWIGEEAEGANANLERWKEYCDKLSSYVKEYAPNGLVDAVYVPFNEVAPYNVDRYAELLPTMCDYLRQQFVHHGGMQVIGGNFSVTTPHPIQLWDKMGSALASMDYLCLHRYSKTSLREGHEWLYDFEQIYARFRSRGFATPKLILGEFGIDGALWTDGSMSREERFRGWQAFMSSQEMAAQFQEAHLRLQNNPDVLFAAVFNLDQYPPIDWGSYLYANYPDIIRVFSGPEQQSARAQPSPAQAQIQPTPSQQQTAKDTGSSGYQPTGRSIQAPPNTLLRQWMDTENNEHLDKPMQAFVNAFVEHANAIGSGPVGVERAVKLGLPRNVVMSYIGGKDRKSAASDRGPLNEPVSRYILWSHDSNNRGPKTGILALGRFQLWLQTRKINPALAFDEGFPQIEEFEEVLEPESKLEYKPAVGKSVFSDVEIQRMAQILNCNEILLRSIIKRESGSRAFGDNGLLIIRFEPHLMERFSRGNSALHKQVVDIFEGEKTWQGTDDYVNQYGSWTPIHAEGQISEWRAYEIASKIDEEIATRSISMGVFQILGDNHDLCGYESAVQQMDSFSQALTNQTFAFINFIMNQPGMHSALKRGDIEEFVRAWNGPGQVERVSALIRQDLREMS